MEVRKNLKQCQACSDYEGETDSYSTFDIQEHRVSYAPF